MRLAAVASAAMLVIGSTVLSACAPGALRDPASPGPYGVGVTTISFTRYSSTTGEPRILETVIWYPTDERGNGRPLTDAPPATKGAPFPVLVFSHGDTDEPTQASYLTEHWATWGYVVVAPPHPGDTKADCPCTDEDRADSVLNRVPDVNFALSEVLALGDDPAQPLSGIVDPQRTAITGYSFGGLTAISAGTEGQFGAVLAMAPGAPSLLLDQARRTRVPILILGAGRDDRVDPTQLRELYDALPGDIPRYYVFLPEAGHHAFRNECDRVCEFPQERAHELVKRYATAFLQVHLVGDERYAHYLAPGDFASVQVTAQGR